MHITLTDEQAEVLSATINFAIDSLDMDNMEALKALKSIKKQLEEQQL